MTDKPEALSIRYLVRIKDPSTNRRCDVYVSSDRDLESLLFFLRKSKSLDYDVRDLREDSSDY